ncbi:MAG: hypothetical protein LWX11_02115, partial [Firmicutes bacterium]|nr:hypothetical protein [Bacillota bacterium]
MKGFFPLLGLVALASAPPVFQGDPEAARHLEEPIRAAVASTERYGAWPETPWKVHLHETVASFERATGAGPAQAAQWRGHTLHLRPWEQLKRRDLGALLRHEMVHWRLKGQGLRRWEEEARCLHAESHVRPPTRWPAVPSAALQARWDRALKKGAFAEQRWAYKAIRAWLSGRPQPAPPARTPAPEAPWRKEAMSLDETVTVVWPSERVPRHLHVNGESLRAAPGRVFRFRGAVRFGEGAPVRRLEGEVRLRAVGRGWELRWTTTPERWIAAATAGELGDDAPFEARRALASVLRQWLKGPRRHPQGEVCPLTHCAVVRGEASPETQRAVVTAPALALEPRWAFFCGSQGGHALSPRAVWGQGPEEAAQAEIVPDDPWATWSRTLTAAQVQLLKTKVRPGLKPGQKGLNLGLSGPYAVESLRLAAGRAFGWTTWPSNACEGTLQPDGSLHLQGHGWG